MAYRAFKFTISGRVQGVDYRAFAKGVAHDTCVVGWVANDTVSPHASPEQFTCSPIDIRLAM